MQPLARQPSRVSLLSWWSDSNPNLQSPATINLHAAAKPLMKFLYHRQALDFIKQNHNRRLTAETLDIYASYLPWKFVAPSTKAAILLEIHHHCLRGFPEELAEHAAIYFSVLPQAKQMLAAPHVRARLASCCVLGSLARYEHVFLSAVLEQESCGSLVALLRDRDQEVIQWAAYALCCITTFGEGAKAVVAANALDHVSQLVGPDSSPEIRRHTRQLVKNIEALSMHSRISIQGLENCLHLVSNITQYGELPLQIHITVATEVSMCPASQENVLEPDDVALPWSYDRDFSENFSIETVEKGKSFKTR